MSWDLLIIAKLFQSKGRDQMWVFCFFNSTNKLKTDRTFCPKTEKKSEELL